MQANSFGKPVTSLTSRPCIGKITRDPCLLATFEDSDQLGLYRIIDDFGTIVPFKSFNSGTGANLKSAIMAPILSYRYVNDGSNKKEIQANQGEPGDPCTILLY